MRETWADERTRTVTGLATLGVSLIFALSILSSLFTGALDIRLIQQSLEVGDAESYHNMLGSVGAHIGYWLAHQGLGIGALIVPLFAAIFGLRWMTDRDIAPLGKTFRLGTFLAMFVPWALAFLSHEKIEGTQRYFTSLDDHLVGASGLWLLNQGMHYLSSWGCAMVLGFTVVGLLAYNTPQLWRRFTGLMGRWFRSAEEVMIDEDAADEDWMEQGQADSNNASRSSASNTLVNRDFGTPYANDPQAETSLVGNQGEEDDDVPFEVRETAPPVPSPSPTPAAEMTGAERGSDMAGESNAEDSSSERANAGSDLEDAVTASASGEELADDEVPFTSGPTGANRREGMELGVEMDAADKAETADDGMDAADEEAGDDVEFEVKSMVEEDILTSEQLDDLTKEFGEFDPTLELGNFQLPSIDKLLNHGDGKHRVTDNELTQNKENILRTLANFNIEVSKITAEVGPTVTLYEIVPAPGIRISKIKNLEDDIALSLSALGIRIIAPIPGKGTIGIEVPNNNPDVVSMKTLIASDKFQNSDAALPVALGKTISNETYVFDLAKMPHLLMAGATGQGKSVGLNAMLVSMLYRRHPSQLKFVLVDPKKVELTLYNKIVRHYLAQLPDSEDAIITDTSKVVSTLNSLCVEMDQRYELLKAAQCRNIKEYNAKFSKRKIIPGLADGHPDNGKDGHRLGHHYMPYIVLVVDEFADLIMTAGKEVETPIARLAQLARAIGIHLIIATQRPSVNIITGTIKANFPARVAFRVTSKIDSRTILDAGGADQLIGRGDMLMSTGNDLIRLQCGFVDTPEVEDICEFIGSQKGYPTAFELPPPPAEANDNNGPIDDDERDPMFEDAARVLVMHQQGSTSLLQRKLKLGYNRAGRLIDQLESAGIIGPFEGSKARKVLVPDEASLEQMLQGSSDSTD